MQEIVKYDNILNELSFTNFDENDLNLFMVLCSRMRDLGDEKQVFEYDYLMDLLEWDKRQRIDVFHNEILKMADKLRIIGTSVNISDDEWVSFDLFPTLRGNKKKRLLTVQINPEFKYILNDISKNFTRFELKEYVELGGRYSKQLYQHLKQFKSSGWWQVSIDDFRRLLSIPDSMETRRIMNKVINPAIEVIRSCKGFSELSVEVLQSKRRGRAVMGYIFRFTADKQIKGQMSLDDYQKVPGKLKRGKKSNFSNIEQHDYNFDELEKLLVDN